MSIMVTTSKNLMLQLIIKIMNTIHNNFHKMKREKEKIVTGRKIKNI
jgi:hypothetical protein